MGTFAQNVVKLDIGNLNPMQNLVDVYKMAAFDYIVSTDIWIICILSSVKIFMG